MGLFGLGNKKKKNTEIKKEIIRELESINSTSIDMNKRITSLEDLVSEHTVLGEGDETKVLSDLLDLIGYIKGCVNSGRESAARTGIENALKKINNDWKTSQYSGNYDAGNSAQTDLDAKKDELQTALKRQEELKAFLLAHPDKQAFYRSEWNTLYKKVQLLSADIARLEKEQQVEINAENLKIRQEELKRTEQRQKESHISVEEINESLEDISERQAEQDSIFEAMEQADSVLYGGADSMGLMGFDGGSSSMGSGLMGFDTGSSGMGLGSGSGKNQDSANIQRAKKKCEENLAKFEAANEDLKEQLAEKDREYNNTIKKARELLAKRDQMSPAEYNTIDYKIDELKIKLKSLAKEKKSFQNVLTQNNLKISMLNQLKAEKDLDVISRYNIDEISMDDLAEYLHLKDDEKNAALQELDIFANDNLDSDVSSRTDVADSANVTLDGVGGDPNKYDDLREIVNPSREKTR